MKVLIVTDGYLPGFKYGGPVRSLAALVERLGSDLDFSIVTSGADLGETQPYLGIPLDTWSRVGRANVFYTMGRRLSPLFWRRIISETHPDVVYLNSFMSPVSSAYLLWRKIRLVPQTPVVLAPRGEFASSALAVKSTKKKTFRRIAGVLRLHAGLTWQASAPAEERDIRNEQPNASRISVAPDLTISKDRQSEGLVKEPGVARFVWLGRIARVKNLEGIFTTFATIREGRAHLELFGPIEDNRYWVECLRQAANLPVHVTYEYMGAVPHERIGTALQLNHFFLSPSRGENFGHTVAEALDQGLPLVLSDQTPWRNLESAGVGWDISLDDTGRWTEVINQCIAMDDNEYQAMSARCREYVAIWMEEHGGKQANLEMFRHASWGTGG